MNVTGLLKAGRGITACTVFRMSWPNVWKRVGVPKYLDPCHLMAKSNVERLINAHVYVVLYFTERERIYVPTARAEDGTDG